MNFFISEKQLKKKKLVENASPLRLIKLEIAAGQASATPPLGPSLGMYGINIAEFCKEFNEESEIFENETIIPIFVYLGINKQHYFEFKLLSVAYLIRKYLESMELESGMISKVDFLKICYNIALFRALIYEKNSINVSESYLKNSIRCIIGTFRSFRYKVIL